MEARQIQFPLVPEYGEDYSLSCLIQRQEVDSLVQLRLEKGDFFHHLADLRLISLALLPAVEKRFGHQHASSGLS